MVALAGNSNEFRSPSSLELTEQLSNQQAGHSANNSSSEDPEGEEEEIHLSSSSSKDQQESATFIDVDTQSLAQQNQQHGFSFRELAKFFGPGLLTCVAYVVRFQHDHCAPTQACAGHSQAECS